ncbi:MAG: GlsB/YeaQ/YmgE family stress response membrane protein [Gemmatimonadetes bacterium]|nr:MAG: GlsB/YeaQ/YmgE family stress response membrane protein [Gemmatimonadota bacterium]
MGIVTWILLGLVAGLLAKIVMPGKDPGGIIVTILLGIAGALVGGFVGTRLGFGNISGFDLRSVAIAAGGAVLLLCLNRFLKRRGAV